MRINSILELIICVRNFSPAMGARNQVGIGLSYRPASLCSLATQFQTRFLESIPCPIAGLKFSTLEGGRTKLIPPLKIYILWDMADSIPYLVPSQFQESIFSPVTRPKLPALEPGTIYIVS